MPVRDARPYVPAIDGLRTVAVMLVVIFHADKTWLPGGFIGVDIFFVISGFLITRNIMADVEHGTWSFSTFYLRRIARLFPALYATIACTLLAAFFVLSPLDLERLGRVALSTVLSISNFVFWWEAGYFDISAGEKPLLHTWSLAVEEQFYLLWPLLIVTLFAVRRRIAVMAGLVIVAIVSFLLAIGLEGRAPDAVFFLTPFRAYQFALGGLIGLLSLSLSDKVSVSIGLLALAALFVLAVLVDGASTGHFWAATMPALAASIIIITAQSPLMTTMLGNGPMVWIGQRSYSIYLVHWPLMVLWTLKAGGQSALQSAVLCALSIILGSVLHTTVEKRFRFTPALDGRQKKRVTVGIAAAAMILTMAGGQYWAKDGYPSRLPEELTELGITDHWVVRQEALRTGQCNMVHDFTLPDFDDALCATVDPDRPSYLVIGDSFAGDTYLVFSKAFPDVHFLQITIPGCRLRLPEDFADGYSSPCRDLYRRSFDEIVKQPGLDGVILASNWLRDDYDQIDSMLNVLSDHDIEIILVGQHIRFQQRLPSIVLSSFSVEEAKDRAKALLLKQPMRDNEKLRERFSDRTVFLDFIALQCPHECDVIDQKAGLMYLDDAHLSFGGAELLAMRLASQQPDLMKSSPRQTDHLEASSDQLTPGRQ